jgi:hypothetical protein
VYFIGCPAQISRDVAFGISFYSKENAFFQSFVSINLPHLPQMVKFLRVLHNPNARHWIPKAILIHNEIKTLQFGSAL